MSEQRSLVPTRVSVTFTVAGDDELKIAEALLAAARYIREEGARPNSIWGVGYSVAAHGVTGRTSLQ